MNPTDWSVEDRPYALVTGALLFDPPAGGTLVATPAGEFVAIHLDPAARQALGDVLGGWSTPAVALRSAGAELRHDLAQVLDLLAAEALLLAAPPAVTGAPAPSADGDVVVVGPTLVAAALVPLLAQSGFTVRAGAPVEGPDDLARVTDDALLVVGCADWLPDRAWQRLDAHCCAAGVPWHRAWREGGNAWVGPLTVPGATASYRDLRTRRLAASDWPDELAATWAHLDDHRPRDPAWAPATAAIVAGVLATDVAALLGAPGPAVGGGAAAGPADGAPWPGAGDPAADWRGLDLAARRWHAHPVLPLPAGVLVEAAAAGSSPADVGAAA